MEDFDIITFFDVETPNSHNDRICSIGVVCVTPNGDEKYRKAFLVNPECTFESKNISIHGISKADCDDAQTFDDIWQNELSNLFLHNKVVAHNACFDLNVLAKTLSFYGLDLPHIQYVCTKKFSDVVLPDLQDHKLPSVCSFFDIPIDKHHDALTDALACKDIYLRMLDMYDDKGLVDVFIPAQYGSSNKLLKSDIKEITKAMVDLYGVIIGISIDGIIKPEELTVLRDWRKEHSDSPFERIKEMCALLDLVLADGVLSAEERSYLFKITRPYTESDSFSAEAIASQELIGILKGIQADNLLNIREAQQLLDWIEDHEELAENTSIQFLKDSLVKALYDGEISVEEKDLLFEKFRKTINPACSSPQSIVFNEKIFVLSGDFIHGSKKLITEYIEEQGGQVSNNVSKKVSYVVKGGKGSPDYNYGTYGIKVKKALELQAKGLPIEVISEDQLFCNL